MTTPRIHMARGEAGLVGMAGVDGAGEGVSRQWLLETVGSQP